MITRNTPPGALLALADAQAGVVSRPQLALLDLPPASERRWRAAWTRLGYGLYCLEEPTWTSWCWAGLLRAGPAATIGGAAAAHLHGLGSRPPEQVTVWHDKSFAIGPMGDHRVGVVFRRAQRQGSGDPTRTTVTDSILDAAGEVDEDEIVALTARALAQHRITGRTLLDGMAERRGIRHRRVLTGLCDAAATGIESVLEWRFLNEVILAHGLPEPRRQQSLSAGTRSDAVWEQFGLVAELDGRLGHEERFREMQRDNRLMLRGYGTLRYGWHDVQHRPCECAWQLAAVLGSRGWTGRRTRCRRCRGARLA